MLSQLYKLVILEPNSKIKLNIVMWEIVYSWFVLQDSLPSVLYLQMDNTCRDNKNKYTLTFAALLVQLNIFRKVGKWRNSNLYR